MNNEQNSEKVSPSFMLELSVAQKIISINCFSKAVRLLQSIFTRDCTVVSLYFSVSFQTSVVRYKHTLFPPRWLAQVEEPEAEEHILFYMNCLFWKWCKSLLLPFEISKCLRFHRMRNPHRLLYLVSSHLCVFHSLNARKLLSFYKQVIDAQHLYLYLFYYYKIDHIQSNKRI